MGMTVDQLIAELQNVRKTAKFGGDTVIAICLDDSELEYCMIQSVEEESDKYGGLIVLHSNTLAVENRNA